MPDFTPDEADIYQIDDACYDIDHAIYEEVSEERMKQRTRGGGFDESNSKNDWITFICRYASGSGDRLWNRRDLEFREAMIKVAALAFAAIEAYDNENC